jgi:glutamate 5-kinase
MLIVKALAAVGQGRLIALWDNLFSQLDQPIAQILLTRTDISDVSDDLPLRPRASDVQDMASLIQKGPC